MLKDLIIEGNNTGYKVCSDGYVLNASNNYKLKGEKTKKGYIRHCINGRKYLEHRLVAMVFLPNINNKSQINHKDGNKENNNVNNLEWVTQSENIKHSYRKLGQENGKKKLKNEDIVTICKRFNNNESCSKIALDYKVKTSTIMSIIRGITYKEHAIEITRRGYKTNNCKINHETANRIRKMCSEGVPQKRLAKTFDLHITTINRIVNNLIWSDELIV